MEITKIVIIGIVGTIFSIILKKTLPEFSLLLGLSVTLVIIFIVTPFLTEIFQWFQKISLYTNTDDKYMAIIMKVIGIAYIAELGSQFCIDAGENAIGQKIQLGGKIMIMYISLPILGGVLDLVFKMLPV